MCIQISRNKLDNVQLFQNKDVNFPSHKLLKLFFSFQGYLYKKSHGLNKEWKKKYVTLSDDGKLSYHPSLHVSLMLSYNVQEFI